jgi:hypothetical protein
MKLRVIAVTALWMGAKFALAQGMVPLAARLPHLGDNSAVLGMTPTALAIVGPVTSGVLSGVLQQARPRPIDTIFIDSAGGSVEVSIALAKYIRERNIRLVVAGRCLSACANFLLVAAKRKDILPGSLIGIHETRYQYHRDTDVIEVSERHKDQLAKLSGDPGATARIAAAGEGARRFYSEMKVSDRYFQAFRLYEASREASGNRDTTSCPRISFWALNGDDLSKMGVKGIGAAWFPASAQEARSAARKLGLDGNQVFYGSEKQLTRLCQSEKGMAQTIKSYFGL